MSADQRRRVSGWDTRLVRVCGVMGPWSVRSLWTLVVQGPRGGERGGARAGSLARGGSASGSIEAEASAKGPKDLDALR